MTTDKKMGGKRRKGWGWRSPFALIFVLNLLLAFSSHAANFGLDTLGLARHDARMVAEELPKGWWIGFLDHTFGDPMPNLELIKNTGKLGGFRVHLRNTVCKRNRNCENLEPRFDDFEALGRDAAKYEAFHNRNPSVECMISPWLEHDEKDRAKVQRAVDTIKKNAPSCTVVISAFTGAVVPGVLVEKHGNGAQGQIISNDGHSLFDANTAVYRTRGSVLVMGWINRNNGRVTGEKVFTPPSKRKFWPSRTDIQQMVRVLQPQSSPPSARPARCKSARNLKELELWKTNAEDYGGSDPRGNRPLLISKSRTARLELVAPDNRVIGCAKYFGAFEKGYHRHYVGSCSGDSPISLMEKARSEWLYVKDGAACTRVNAIRRKGYFRE